MHPLMEQKLNDYEVSHRFKYHKQEMKHQVISFGLMIFLTLISFLAVWANLSVYFIVPFILLLAFVQVIFQLYYFMHMKEKGHHAVQLFLYAGIVVGFITILAFLTIVWW